MELLQLFEGHGWRVTLEEAKLPDGRVKKMARVHQCDRVHILAFDHDERVVLLREYRPYWGTFIWMLPSGKVDKETDIARAADRELREETGLRAKNLTFYCSFAHSESLLTTNHIFLGRDLVEDPLPQDENEMIEMHSLSLDEAIRKVLGSSRVHIASAAALLRYAYEKTKEDSPTVSTLHPQSRQMERRKESGQ